MQTIRVSSSVFLLTRIMNGHAHTAFRLREHGLLSPSTSEGVSVLPPVVESSPKNNRMRQIPLASDLHKSLLRNHEAVAHNAMAHVFTETSGEPLSTKAAQTRLNHALHRANVRHIGWHALRHSFASHLATNGMPLIAIQSLLGHSTIQMTMRYAHAAPDMLRDAIASLGRVAQNENVTIVSPNDRRPFNPEFSKQKHNQEMAVLSVKVTDRQESY